MQLSPQTPATTPASTVKPTTPPVVTPAPTTKPTSAPTTKPTTAPVETTAPTMKPTPAPTQAIPSPTPTPTPTKTTAPGMSAHSLLSCQEASSSHQAFVVDCYSGTVSCSAYLVLHLVCTRVMYLVSTLYWILAVPIVLAYSTHQFVTLVHLLVDFVIGMGSLVGIVPSSRMQSLSNWQHVFACNVF